MRFTFCLLLLFPLLAQAQKDDPAQAPPDQIQQIIEDFLQNTDSEGSFDYNTLLEQFELYQDQPINLNEADEATLQELLLLSDLQIINLIKYRQETGAFISIYELQAVPSFDLPTIRKILPFVAVKGEIDDYQLSLGEMISDGSNELYLRWSRILEDQRGYLSPEEGGSENGYLGDPNQLYVRYKHFYSNKFSYGFTAEKDRGEEFFTGSNQKGFDYYSAHIFLRDYNSWLKAVALGDYAVSFGQGLILYSGFGYGKSSQPIQIKRTSRTIRAYTSVNEVDFLRGGAATISLNRNMEFTAFASYRQKDGNLIEPDTSQLDRDIQFFTSLGTSGLHRTQSEIEDRNVIDQFTVGGSFRYSGTGWHISANALYDQFDKKLDRNLQPYNRFYFNEDRLLNASVDYSWVFQNFNFFGETAMSDNGAIATVNGLLIGLDRKVDMAILHRYFPRDYQALNANPFAETSGARNENGIYMGLEVRPTNNWKLTAYYDIWKHEWLRFQVDAPSKGHEYRARLTYYLKRDLDIYLEVRDEIKERHAPNNDSQLNYLTDFRVFQTRLHIAKKVSKSLEVRTRLDYGFSENEVDGRSPGMAVYQDILYRPLGFPLSFTARFAIYDSEGFQTKFYSYENNLLYTFSIPAYYNKGTRYYLNLRYKGFRNLTIEGRIAQTYYFNREVVGSSREETTGPTRTQVAAQIKYKF